MGLSKDKCFEEMEKRKGFTKGQEYCIERCEKAAKKYGIKKADIIPLSLIAYCRWVNGASFQIAETVYGRLFKPKHLLGMYYKRAIRSDEFWHDFYLSVRPEVLAEYAKRFVSTGVK